MSQQLTLVLHVNLGQLVPSLHFCIPPPVCCEFAFTALPRCQIFGDFLRPVFSASRVQHVSDLHPKFALRPHHVWKYHMVDIQSATAEIRRGKKDRR